VHGTLLDSVRAANGSRDPEAVLRQPTSVLIGVSEHAAAVLAQIDIETVFDLATSELLSHARNITLLAEEGEGSFSSVAKRANERKARLLLGALGVEVVGVGLVAAALGVAFAT